LRYLGISTVGGVDIVDYPDSKKIAIAAGVKNADFKTAMSAWGAKQLTQPLRLVPTAHDKTF
jgi:hypothetical protein